jgi:hypothetical protein
MTKFQIRTSGRATYAALAALAIGTLANQAIASGYTVVVGGLHSPRGLTFAPGGRLYVAEAGGVAGHASAIDEVVNWATDHATLRTVVRGLPSTEGNVGADGISAQGNGDIFAIIAESEQAEGPGFGHLIKVNTAGQVRDVADVGDVDYAFTGNHPELDPDHQFPDANPYGVLALPGHIYVADAGANTLDEVSPSGRVTILAYFANPPISDAVPTTVAQGPDGALYIGTLALAESQANGPSAKIYRIEIGELSGATVPVIGAEHEWATGFSPIQNMAFGPDGSLYVSEDFVQGILGDIVKIPFNDPATRISLTGATLPFPGGVAVASDGTVYAVGWAVSPLGFVARLAEK